MYASRVRFAQFYLVIIAWEMPLESPLVSTPVRVSVIIAAWNAERIIERCLYALETQTIARHDYEIIVVNNGSTDQTGAIVALHSSVILLSEARVGSYVARNTGIRCARGAYLAFTDADCVPANDWLERAMATAVADGAAIVAGKVELRGEANELAMIYERAFAFRQAQNVPKGLCVTANWLSPAKLIREFGGFDEETKSGGDWKLSSTIKSAGHRVVYEPKMIVYHPPRPSLAEIAIKRRRVAGGVWATQSGGRVASALKFQFVDCLRKLAYAANIKPLPILTRLKLMGLILYFSAISVNEVVRLAGGRATTR